MNAILAHLNVAPFVQHAARALHEAGWLRIFATQLVEEQGAAWQKALVQGSKLARYDLARQLGRRRVTEVPTELLRTRPRWELARLAVSRVDKDKRPTDWVFHKGLYDFDRWVARKLLGGMDAVYAYEYGCEETFRVARGRGIRTIYDVPSPEHDFVHRILDAETKPFEELETPYVRYCRERQDARTDRRRNEFDRADVVVAASEFTRSSFLESGWDASKVVVVPYGAPPVNPTGPDGGTRGQGPVRFLWAGTFSVRKGAHKLLEAWRQLAPDPAKARLEIYGANALPQHLIANLPRGVEMKGTVPRSELYGIYKASDLLLFPTLCDGFGLVVTESFANGLPVLTTLRAGAADLVQDKHNGFLVPAGEVAPLAEALSWAIDHRDQLAAMRPAALETAASWQWEDYRKGIREAVETLQQPTLPSAFATMDRLAKAAPTGAAR